MDGGSERVSFSWWWDSLGMAPHHSQWLQHTLSEVEQNIKGLLTLIQKEDGASFTRKPELVKRVEELRGLHCSLVEFCNQLPVQSSLSSSSRQQLKNLHNVDRVIKLPFPDSIPKSSVDDPEPEYYAKNIARDEMSSGLSVGKTEEIATKKDGFGFNAEMAGDSEALHSFEQMSRFIENNCGYLNELARRNEEKREANKELWSRTEKLVAENRALVEQLSKLMEENGTLHMKLQVLINESRDLLRCSKLKNHSSQLSRLKALLRTVWARG